MGDLRRLASKRMVEEEASVWLARVDAGLTPERRAELGEWLRADPRHRDTFVRMAAMWDEIDVLQELAELFPLPERTRPATPARYRWAAGAVAGLVAVGLLATLTYRGSDVVPAPADHVSARTTTPAPAMREAVEAPSRLVTAVGQQRAARLPDGTMVQLNTATDLRVAFTRSQRKVVLRSGEAQFDVFHDASRPFVVQVGTRTVRAVGTAFNVRVAPDRVTVVVTEGRVAIADSDARATQTAAHEVQVVAGEVAELGATAPVVRPTDPVGRDALLAWQRGMLVFRGEPLGAALAEVERYTSVRFEIGDAEARELRIGGYYRIGDVDGLVRSLQENFPLVISRHGDIVTVESAESH
jgi:transmembrane sensor